jgi:hypothetical protein
MADPERRDGTQQALKTPSWIRPATCSYVSGSWPTTVPSRRISATVENRCSRLQIFGEVCREQFDRNWAPSAKE